MASPAGKRSPAPRCLIPPSSPPPSHQTYYTFVEPDPAALTYSYDWTCPVDVSWYALGFAVWETIIEQMTLKLKGSLRHSAKVMMFDVSDLVQIHLPLSFVSSMQRVFEGWASDSRPHAPFASSSTSTSSTAAAGNAEHMEEDQDVFLPKAVRNMTGMNMTCKLSGGVVATQLAPGETRRYTSQEVTGGHVLSWAIRVGSCSALCFSVICLSVSCSHPSPPR
jgi:hypothetical protein